MRQNKPNARKENRKPDQTWKLEHNADQKEKFEQTMTETETIKIGTILHLLYCIDHHFILCEIPIQG
jgi:hypothetical protein